MRVILSVTLHADDMELDLCSWNDDFVFVGLFCFVVSLGKCYCSKTEGAPSSMFQNVSMEVPCKHDITPAASGLWFG